MTPTLGVHSWRGPRRPAPGPHWITIELAEADHRPLAREAVKFDVPRR